TTVPETEALVGHPYSYTAGATDPDGDSLTFSLVVGPTGMTINAASGQITWSPTSSDLGTNDVTILVDDGRGGSARQHYLLSAITPPPNRPPIFTSVPVTTAYVNTPYTYDANATDPDNDGLTFSLQLPPPPSPVSIPTVNSGFETPILAEDDS